MFTNTVTHAGIVICERSVNGLFRVMAPKNINDFYFLIKSLSLGN